MEEFNLELAKAGHPVQTKSGRKVRIICWDARYGQYPIIALIEDPSSGKEDLGTYTPLGRYSLYIKSPERDLAMASEKHEGWINLYKNVVGVYPGQNIYKTKEAAESGDPGNSRIATIKIEWEE